MLKSVVEVAHPFLTNPVLGVGFLFRIHKIFVVLLSAVDAIIFVERLIIGPNLCQRKHPQVQLTMI